MESIELEYRGEIPIKSLPRMIDAIRSKCLRESVTQRLSVMFFSKNQKKPIDIRIRATNSDCEIVIKRGAHHASDRTEFAQQIEYDQFIGLTRLLSFTNTYEIKVGQRETYNFNYPDRIWISLVRAKNIAYFEIEKITSKKNIKADIRDLEKIAKYFNLKVFSDESGFSKLCDRLTSDGGDWIFNGTQEHFDKLKKMLNMHLSKFKKKLKTP